MKSTPVMWKGGASRVRVLGSGGGSGTEYGFPRVFLQITQDLRIPLTHRHTEVIQKFCLSAVTVWLTPPCNCVVWAASTISFVSACREGNK